MMYDLTSIPDESSIKDIDGLRNTGVCAKHLASLHRLFHQKINRTKKLEKRLPRDRSMISPLSREYEVK
jgi:hypothetical protein